MILNIITGIGIYLIGVALAYVSTGLLHYCIYRYDKKIYDREKTSPVFIILSYIMVILDIVAIFILIFYMLPDPIKLFKKDKK